MPRTPIRERGNTIWSIWWSKGKLTQSHMIKHWYPDAHTTSPFPSIQWQNFQSWIQLFLPLMTRQKNALFSPSLFYLDIICSLLFFQIIWERSFLRISPDLEQCRGKYFSLSGSPLERRAITAIHLWVSGCVSLGQRQRKRSCFFIAEIKPAEARHPSTDPLQPNFLFPIWSSQHPAYWIFIIIFRACSQDASVFVAQWGCQHQALQYQCCFISEVQLHRSGMCFLLNFWFWSHRPLWWGEHVLLWLRSEPQQHFVYWLAEGIALAWLCSPLWKSFYMTATCRFAVLGE